MKGIWELSINVKLFQNKKFKENDGSLYSYMGVKRKA